MEYPPGKMTKNIRRIFFAFFFLIFLILSPAIILYTSGYRYDWQNGLLRETGAIDIDVEPKDAAVFLNDIKVKTKMPARLNDRVPGQYKIQLRANDYYEWDKIVEVKNKETIYIKEISLLKKNEPETMSDEPAIDLALSPDGQYLAAVVRQNNSSEIRLRQPLVENSQEQTIARFPADKKIELTWAGDYDWLAVSDAQSPHQIILLFNATQPNEPTDLIKIAQAPIQKFQWKKGAAPELYFSTNKKIMSWVGQSEQILTLGANKYRDWLMDNDQLWTIQATGTTGIKIVRDTLGFSSTYANETAFDPNEQDLAIVAAGQDRILLKKNGRSEMSLFSNGQKYNISGENFVISKNNNWWVIWTPWEIWTSSPNEAPYLLNRSGEQLRRVLPMDKWNTLCLVWSAKTTALFPYYLVTNDLLNLSVSAAAADAENKILYFSGKIGSKEGVWKLGY